MSTKRQKAGFTLVEYLIAIGVGSLVLGVLATASFYGATQFNLVLNYTALLEQERLTLDTISREVREADRITVCTSNQLTLASATSNLTTYAYDAGARLLSRVNNGTTTSLLRDCDYVRFDMFQRNPTNGTYDCYPAASTNECKVVQVTLASSRSMLGRKYSTSVQQSAKVVIRKQH